MDCLWHLKKGDWGEHSANKNTGYTIKFEFQKSHAIYFTLIFLKRVFIACLNSNLTGHPVFYLIRTELTYWTFLRMWVLRLNILFVKSTGGRRVRQKRSSGRFNQKDTFHFKLQCKEHSQNVKFYVSITWLLKSRTAPRFAIAWRWLATDFAPPIAFRQQTPTNILRTNLTQWIKKKKSFFYLPGASQQSHSLWRPS